MEAAVMGAILEVTVLPKDTTRGAGFEPPTLWSLNNWLYSFLHQRLV